MRIQPWARRWWWLSGVAMGATLLGPVLATAWIVEPIGPLSLIPDKVAAIPPPPAPPRLPGGALEADPLRSALPPFADPPGAEPAEDVSVVEPSGVDAPVAGHAALFEDEQANAGAGLAVAREVPQYPVVVNATVEALIDYFTARERPRFELWLARSGRYLGMIQQRFRERGLPEELAYTAMIESGFSPRAVSRVGAKGLWQFMEATGRRYGLVVNRWVDERFDPVKSTEAAARYLGDLYGMFGHWFLAQAGYNAGEARVARAIHRARTNDFWALTQTRHLPNETKLFVPQILAAMLITQNPSRYGFEVVPEPPLEYDEVVTTRGHDLQSLALLADTTVQALQELNPALRTGITPPVGRYTLRVPKGTGPRLEAALDRPAAASLATWGTHRVGRNQSLAELSRLYRIPVQRLVEVNGLRGHSLRTGSELVVPVSQRVETKTRPPRAAGLASSGSRDGEDGGFVVVQPGDTLWGIAVRHGVELRTLARLNGRELDDPLYPGDRLKLQ